MAASTAFPTNTGFQPFTARPEIINDLDGHSRAIEFPARKLECFSRCLPPPIVKISMLLVLKAVL
jgi:hypothetical protein